MVTLFFKQGSDAAACQEWLQEQPIQARWLRGGRSSAAQCQLEGSGEKEIEQICTRLFHARTEEPEKDPLWVITGKNCLTGKREILTPPASKSNQELVFEYQKSIRRKSRRKQPYTLLRLEKHQPEQLTLNFQD